MKSNMNNPSLRAQFDLDDKSASQVSRLINAAVKAGLIKAYDKTTAPRYMSYVPVWA